MASEKERNAEEGLGVPHRKGWGTEPALGEPVWGTKASARPELRRGAVRAEGLCGTGEDALAG